VVTRAPEQAEELIRQLHQLGADVLLFPAVSFVDPADSEALDAALDSLPQFHWLLFTSQNAVRFFTKRRRARGGGATAGQPLIAAVGPATAAAAERQGFRVEYVAGRFRGAALAEELGPRLAGKKILLPRSDLASGDLPAALRAAGADVTDVVAYRTVAPDGHDRSTAEAVSRGVVDVVTFLSPSALRHVAEEVGVEALRRVALAAIGPVTAAAIRDAGLAVEIEAREATAASLVTAIADYFTERLPSGVKSP
jgi:uroporphyrinogen III methyltransferase/synthase